MTPALVSLIIFILCIILFVIDKLPMATTAILGCAVMVIAGVCDFKTAFGQFASSTVILTIGDIRDRTCEHCRPLDSIQIQGLGDHADYRHVSCGGASFRISHKLRRSRDVHPDNNGALLRR